MNKNFIKKTISMLLLLCMLFSVMPSAAFAAEDGNSVSEPAAETEESTSEPAAEAEEPVQAPAAEAEEPDPTIDPEESVQEPTETETPTPEPVEEAEAEEGRLPDGMELRGSTLVIVRGYSFNTDEVAAAAESVSVTAIENGGTITEGAAEIGLPVHNNQGSAISGGVFTEAVSGYVNISGGTFYGPLSNPYGRISGGEFHGAIDTGSSTLILSGGTIYGSVKGRNVVISGGTFTESSNVEITVVGGISGGEFYGKVTCRWALLLAGSFYGTVENRNGTFYEDEKNSLEFSESAVIINGEDGSIYAGSYPCTVVNNGAIYGGTFNGDVTNNGTIYDGVFEKPITNNGTILGGTFNEAAENYSRILGGQFNGETTNYRTILGGSFLALTNLGEAVTLPEGLGVSGNGQSLVLAAGHSFDTDALNQAAYALGVSTVENHGTITAGESAFALNVVNYEGSKIEGGEFTGDVTGHVSISGGSFSKPFDSLSGRISGGEFHGDVNAGGNTLIISGGTFHGSVKGRNLVISDGTFEKTSTVTIESVGGIEGGTFYGTVDCRYTLLHGGTFYGTVENRGGVFYLDGNNKLVIDPGAVIHVGTDGRIDAGNYPCKVVNDGEIHGGTFNGDLTNNGTIYDGVFEKPIINNGTILGGTFQDNAENYSRIYGGSFLGETTNYSVIAGGSFAALTNLSDAVTLPEGLGVSADGRTLLLRSGYSFNTDELTKAAAELGDDTVENHGVITAGENPLTLNVVNCEGSKIESGDFRGAVSGYINITGGSFSGKLHEVYGFIGGGEFKEEVYTKEYSLQIDGGTFAGKVYGRNIVTGGGTFNGDVEVNTVGGIEGGTFNGSLSLCQGSIRGGSFYGDVSNGGTVQENSANGLTLAFDPAVTLTNNGELHTADYPCTVVNNGTIKDGFYTGDVTNNGIIEGGTFSRNVTNTPSGVIRGGRFNGGVNGEEGGVVLPEGFDVSDDRSALIVLAGHSFTVDEILQEAAVIEAASLENRGTVTAGTEDMELPVTNSGSISGVSFRAAVINESTGRISNSLFNGEVTNLGAITGSTFHGLINVPTGGRITGAVYGENASVGEHGGSIEVYYYTCVNGVTGQRQKASYGAKILAVLPAPAAYTAWYSDSAPLPENLVSKDDAFGLETKTYVQRKESAPVIDWASLAPTAITYGQTLSASKLPASTQGSFSWKVPNTKATVEGGKAGYTVVFTPSAASRARYDYTDAVLEAPVKLTVAPKTITLRLYSSSKVYGEPDPRLWGSYDGTLAGENFGFTVTREPGEDAGTYALIAHYDPLANYTVNVIPATLVIRKLSVTVTPDSVSKVWGESDPELTATVSAVPAGCESVKYSLQREPGEDVGVYAITVVPGANANYQISSPKAGTLTVTAKPLAQLVLDEIEPQSFTGAAIQPVLTVKDGETVLNPGRDYSLSFRDNTWPGTATVTVTGAGHYRGSLELHFTIAAPVSSWQTVNGQRVYFDANGDLATGLVTIENSVYYFNSAGVAQTGWQTVGSAKYYFDPASGVMQTGLQTIGDQTYYLNASGVMQTGWVTVDGQTYYFNANGVLQKSCFVTVSGKTYYVDANGVRRTGWVTVGGQTYYLDANGVMQKNGFITVSGEQYYLDANGVRQTGWVTAGGQTYYFNANGVMQKNCLVTVGGNQYCLDANGVRQTGWVTVSGKTYYFNANGMMQKDGFVAVGGSQYYLDANGVRQTGWVTVSGKTYYLNANGVMQKNGFITVSGSQYYLDANGVRQTGFVTVGGKTYYLDVNGVMQKNGFVTVDGKSYYLNADGILQKNGFVTVNGSRYYLDADGVRQTGWVTVGSKTYYLDANGVVQKNGFVTVSGEQYYLDAGGVRQTGFVTVGGKTYYLNNSGVMQKNGFVTVGGSQYYLDADGVRQTGWVTVDGKTYCLNDNGVMQKNGFITVGGEQYYLDADGVRQTGWVTVGGKTYYLDANGVMQKNTWVKDGSREYYLDADGVRQTQVAAPELSSVKEVTGGIQITWGKVTGAAKYRVYYKTGSSWKKLDDTTSTSYTWKKAKSGTTYSFTVRCVSSDGKDYTSDYDKAGLSLTYGMLATPKLKSVKQVTGGIKITWGKVTGAAKYRVYYKTANGAWKKLTDTASTSYTWKKAKSGTTYSFTVRCVSSNGKSYTSDYDKTGRSIAYVK